MDRDKSNMILHAMLVIVQGSIRHLIPSDIAKRP